MTIKEIKKEAHGIIKSSGLKGKLFLVWFIYTLITTGCSFFGIGSLIFTGPFTLGLTIVSYKTIKNKDFDFKNLFSGFNKFGETFALNLLISIFIILWTCLLIIPGIIAMLSYSMAYYIMIDHPELSAFECLQASKKLMKGHKIKLLGLMLSYILWYLLVIITLGIMNYFVAPKIACSKMVFYQDLVNHNLDQLELE